MRERQRREASPLTWTLPDPMFTVPVADPGLPPGSTAEPKWDESSPSFPLSGEEYTTRTTTTASIGYRQP
ncbi:hypothetical protein [Streptomyces sp. PAL114]|uniref:hypothetical protein n=1 Tax=Streptomyces sp. PAL114 TaxID=2970893 RepID=UPI0028FDAE7B|nr:hypothetical protein [Streptomyces sp. PAL114]MDU0299571.1 hypothetical protein [Streptomyces sp. PAL114]